jgi:GDPmannose 4,6-dehydratase
LAGRAIGFDIVVEGKGVQERGINRKTGRVVVKVNRRFYRPAEVDVLIGNPAKARKKLGWKPKVAFADLVRLMALADDRRVRDGWVLI